MRTVPPEVTATERGNAQAPRHRITLARAHMRVGQASLTITQAAQDACHSYWWDGQRFYAAWRTNAGQLVVTVSNDGGLRTSGALTLSTAPSTPDTMRCAMYYADAQPKVYYCDTSGGAWRLRRGTLSGTSNPLTVSWSTVATFGAGGSASSVFVRRIEAIHRLANSDVIIVEAEHRFDTGTSALYFWHWPYNSTIRKLDTVLTFDLDDAAITASTDWHTVARACTFSAAEIDTATSTIYVVANAANDARGVGVWFKLRNGVESVVQSVIPADPESSGIQVLPCSALATSSGIHLVARVSRAQSDAAGTTDILAYDALLSMGRRGWGFGGVSHVLSSGAMHGQLVLRGDDGRYTGQGWTANVAPGALHGGTSYLDVTTRQAGWSLSQSGEGADSLTVDLTNVDGALEINGNAEPGALIRLWTSHAGVGSTAAIAGNEAPAGWAKVGEYGIDRAPSVVTIKGRGVKTLTARDWGRRTLADYGVPFAGQMRGRGSMRTLLTTLNGLQRMTPERGYELRSDGLRVTGLNEPFVALADIPVHGGDFLARMTARFAVTDSYHLSSVGVVLAAADGRGNVIFVPKTHSWSGHTQAKPRLRTLALGAIDPNDPDALNTGWTLEERMCPLVEEAGETTAITDAVTATYRTDTSYQIPVATDTDIAVRVAGRYACVFTKPRVMTPASIAENATWTLRTRVEFDGTARKTHAPVSRVGLIACTDVFASRTAFDQAEYGDMELGLTSAAETADFSVQIGEACNPRLQGVSPGDPSKRILLNTPYASMLDQIWVGQWLKFVGTGFATGTHYIKVTAKGGSYFDFELANGSGIANDALDNPCDIYRNADGAEWAYALSSNDSYEVQDPTEETIEIPRDTGAVMRARKVGGRGAFISQDNTAVTLRYVESDGVRHALKSGNTTRDVGWDALQPTDAGAPFGSVGSAPGAWRMLLHHGRLFEASATAYGLPASGYMRIGDERVRYMDATFARRGQQSNTTWCVIPTYYFPLAAAAAGSTTLTQWSDGGVYPGDDPSTITSPAGLLVEITSRNRDSQAESKQYYVSSVASHQCVVAPAYPHALRALESVAILSGRGQHGTLKVSHDADAPVAYDPCDSNGNAAHIQVSRFGVWSGQYQSTEDAITRLCDLAGMRSSDFRTLNRPSQSGDAQLLAFDAGSVSEQLDMIRDPSDFVLILQDAYLPKSATSWLTVYFRDYYRLDLAQHTAGTVRLRLTTTDTSVSAYSGVRTLEAVDVPITSADLSSSTSRRVELRVIAQGDELIVEIEGQPVWTFDLASLTDGTNSYLRTTAAGITIGYIDLASSVVVHAEVQELGGECGDIFLRPDDSAMEAIRAAIGPRHVVHRANQSGGVEFGAWESREHFGEIGARLTKDAATTDDAQAVTHVIVVGDGVSGEALDETGARTYGYRVDVVDSQTARTVAQAQQEARLALRNAKEWTMQRDLEGVWHAALQPHDQVTLQYAVGSTGISQADTDVVITEITTDASPAGVKARYAVRRYVA